MKTTQEYNADRELCKKEWEDFKNNMIAKYGLVPVPVIPRAFIDDVKFEQGRIEFFPALDEEVKVVAESAKKVKPPIIFASGAIDK